MIAKTDINKIAERVVRARIRLLDKYPFFGVLMCGLSFAVDTEEETAATDGRKIYFSVDFTSRLSDDALDFVMLHELMHIVLGHIFREENRDHHTYNVAADIVINSMILDLMNKPALKVDGNVPMHVTPIKTEGKEHTAEQVYEMLKGQSEKRKPLDNHKRWFDAENDVTLKDDIAQKVVTVAAMVKDWKSDVTGEHIRKIVDIYRPKINWKEVLRDFLQFEINDYSFTPPDNRYLETPFFLPSFNEKNATKTEEVWFFVDVSGSVDADMLSEIMAEIKGVMADFGDALIAKMAYFSTFVTELKPLEGSFDKLVVEGAKTSGGTDFGAVFRFLEEKKDDLPKSLIIMTDGYCDFPDESAALNVPVLWIITTDVVPPFGRLLRISK